MASKYSPFVVGERVYLKRRPGGRVAAGTIQEVHQSKVFGRHVTLAMDGGGIRTEACSDLSRTIGRKRKAWLESERQGGGRRYWFRTSAECGAFAASKVRKGFHVADDGDNVWVSNGRQRTDEVVRQQAGKEAANG